MFTQSLEKTSKKSLDVIPISRYRNSEGSEDNGSHVASYFSSLIATGYVESDVTKPEAPQRHSTNNNRSKTEYVHQIGL